MENRCFKNNCIIYTPIIYTQFKGQTIICFANFCSRFLLLFVNIFLHCKFLFTVYKSKKTALKAIKKARLRAKKHRF